MRQVSQMAPGRMSIRWIFIPFECGQFGALDGNLMENQSSISGSLTGLSIEGGYFLDPLGRG